MAAVTPENVLSHCEASSNFLCTLSDNIYDIRFGTFRLREMNTNQILFEFERDFYEATEDSRFIQYAFPAQFLNYRSLGTTIHFSVGDNPVNNFRMIERHYFRNSLLQTFDYTIPFMMPNSVNTHEFIYDLPALPEELVNEMVRNPYESKSDSFFFVDGKLVIHVRAEYDYSA